MRPLVPLLIAAFVLSACAAGIQASCAGTADPAACEAQKVREVQNRPGGPFNAGNRGR